MGKYLIFFLFFLSFYLNFSLLVVSVFYPAYFSTVDSCENLKVKREVVGKFYVVDGSPRIDIYDNNLFTLKHELCHYQQWQEGRLFSCEDIQMKYLNEAECYFKEKFVP